MSPVNAMNAQSVFQFGINLSFAVKRWPEPHAWARIVRESMNLSLVQFTFDLLDPWWPEESRDGFIKAIRHACQEYDITIHSAFVGLANYTYNNLLHPVAEVRAAALTWWKRAVEIAAELGAKAVGGPLGGLSVSDAGNEERRSELYSGLLDAICQISSLAKSAGLEGMLIEPTPLEREYPHTVFQAQQMLQYLEGKVHVPVRYVLDVGHALYQPLYGSDASIAEWLEHLGQDIGVFHLQNTDFLSDSHWGWPHEGGRFDVAAFAQDLKDRGLLYCPIFLEVFYPFELSDSAVLENIVHSVKHCQVALGQAVEG